MLRVGIIGAGKMCQNGHLPAFDKIEDCEIVAVCDINPKQLAKAKKLFAS